MIPRNNLLFIQVMSGCRVKKGTKIINCFITRQTRKDTNYRSLISHSSQPATPSSVFYLKWSRCNVLIFKFIRAITQIGGPVRATLSGWEEEEELLFCFAFSTVAASNQPADPEYLCLAKLYFLLDLGGDFFLPPTFCSVLMDNAVSVTTFGEKIYFYFRPRHHEKLGYFQNVFK